MLKDFSPFLPRHRHHHHYRQHHHHQRRRNNHNHLASQPPHSSLHYHHNSYFFCCLWLPLAQKKSPLRGFFLLADRWFAVFKLFERVDVWALASFSDAEFVEWNHVFAVAIVPEASL